MREHPPINGAKSAVFEGAAGDTVPASRLAMSDYLIDPQKYASEGNWAFCRFDDDEVPALRLGFQRGGFNGGALPREPSPRYLQLHLELMTRDGAILWLPSGVYPADQVVTAPDTMDIRLDRHGRNLLRMSGWPAIDCHFCSADGDLQADLRFTLDSVTTLPDCLLPHCLFAMWESMGRVSGSVRYRDLTVAVNGTVFLDHTRVIAARHAVRPRSLYVYTTLRFEDGGGMYGYYTLDVDGQIVAACTYVIHLDALGNGELIEDAVVTNLRLDADGIAKSWDIAFATGDASVALSVRVRDTRLLRAWGSPSPPQSLREFSIIPLVLDATVCTTADGGSRTLRAAGLAEYFNADLWPADKQAMEAATENP